MRTTAMIAFLALGLALGAGAAIQGIASDPSPALLVADEPQPTPPPDDKDKPSEPKLA